MVDDDILFFGDFLLFFFFFCDFAGYGRECGREKTQEVSKGMLWYFKFCFCSSLHNEFESPSTQRFYNKTILCVSLCM